MLLDHHRSILVKGGEVSEIDDAIAVEDRFLIIFNKCLVTEMIASRHQLHELGAGFVISEGLAWCIDKVTVHGDRILVYSDTGCDVSSVKKEIGSSGGMSVQREPSRVKSELQITRKDVFSVTREIESEIWRKTGAVHCSVLFSDGKCLVKSSDIGRHNTVDKVIGYGILNGIDLTRCVIGCTGRQPAGMIRKDANAGIPIVISRAASTDKGIATAEAAGITLICFSRGDRFTVYTHPERIQGIE